MNIAYEAFPPAWHLAALAAMIPLWLKAARALSDARFAHSGQAHVFWGACLGVVLLWSLKATVAPHLTLHLLGVTAVTLMFGAPAAIALATFAVFVLAAIGSLPWQAIPANALLMGALPAGVTAGWLHLVERRLPAHFFVYVFAAAFLGGALAIVATGLATGALLALAGAQPWPTIVEQYWVFFLHMAYAEATLTGMLVTLMVVYQPEWVATFDDRRYLRGR